MLVVYMIRAPHLLFNIRQASMIQAVLGIRDILVPNPTPDPTSFFIDFKDAKKNFHIFFF
jgi:hypothetical protein